MAPDPSPAVTSPVSAPEPVGYRRPEIDVPAFTRLLDGRYGEVRDLVRSNLAAYASVLEEAERLGTDEFRDRVRDLVVEMAAT
ncbi:MAG TPA: acyl-CoA oxidase, partial [Nocardioides sp.]